jgi:uncharacterized RDD family membrane protein YckC
MKCPKCQYLAFDGQTRCRHCGYDLSLAATVEVPPFVDAASTLPSGGAAAGPELEDVVYRREPSARAQARAAIQKRAASRTPAPDAFDLPLFATPGVDDRPALPASRPPLSVRRPITDAPRARAAAAAAFAPAPASAPAPDRAPVVAPEPELPLADTVPMPMVLDTEPVLGFDAPLSPRSPAIDEDVEPMTLGGTPLAGEVRFGGGTLTLPGREASPSASGGFARLRPAAPVVEPPTAPIAPVAGDVGVAPSTEPSADEGNAAPLGRRMLAGLADLAVLGTIDAAVVGATLQATGVEWSQIGRLPIAPLVVFLLLLAVGYLAMCTVLAGRTFGKAAFGLAVVETGGRPVRLAPAVVRALIQVLTVPAFGMGFLPALLGADRRSLYDRLAGTDVVRDPRSHEDLPSE